MSREPADDPEAPTSREESIFAEAVGLPPAERAAHVLRAARGDRTLAGRVLDLLAAHATAGAFLEAPAVRPRRAAVAEVREGPGSVIGPYELLEELGEGGFGVVYRARQLEPVRREVALKIIKLGMDTRQVIARFEAERQALAVLDHPHIARVLDAGATATGRPYFVMELVEGVDVTRYCDARRLPPRARIGIFLDVCDALQHAHQKGLIHRDLKPSNILVTERDGRHVPKVIDFGIAKATTNGPTERSALTELGQFIGTPAYMSPEQAEHCEAEIDTRSDIYSLGVVLYELLAGATPFDTQELRDRGLAEIRTFIREHEPPPPSARVTRLGRDATALAEARATPRAELAAGLRGDLDWIVMKALEKERERRYESCAAFARDLQRHLACLPVLAGPPSVLYRARKFVRRHRLAVGAGAVVVVALFVGVALMLVGFVQARALLRVVQGQNAMLADIVAALSSSGGDRFDATEANEVLVSFERYFGADHPAEAGLRRLLAEQLEEAGQSAEAIAEFRRALELAAAVHGERSREHTLLLAQLGGLLERTGVRDDALLALSTALAVEETAFGRRRVVLNGARYALARLTAAAGDADGATDLCRAAYEVVRAEDPDNDLGCVRAAQAYLMQGTLTGRYAELGPVWLELLAAVDRLYPPPRLEAAQVRQQLAQWNIEAGALPEALVVRELRDAIGMYDAEQADQARQRAGARTQLAELLLEHKDPADIDEALDLLAAALADLRAAVPATTDRALAAALDAAAERFEAGGRFGAALEAHLEVVRLRRIADGFDAEVRRNLDALERLAQALVYDLALRADDPAFQVGLRAVEFLQAELAREAPANVEARAMYGTLHDALSLRAGDPWPAIRRVTGQGQREGALHPMSFALAALASSVSNPKRAAEYLARAEEMARSPQFQFDRKSQEMIAFVRVMLGRIGPAEAAHSAADGEAGAPERVR